MRVVFMGTPSFAVTCLRALHGAHDVVAVCTRPDQPAGRGRVLTASPVAIAAHDMGLATLKPPTLKDPSVARRLASLAPDVICVAAYGMLLPRDVLHLPKSGCLNVHASLLPRWRGAAPVERAILAGDEVTGVSIMRMEEGLDTGPVAMQVEVAVDELSGDVLRERLAEAGAAALLEVMEEISGGTVSWIPQPDAGVTYAEKIRAAEVALVPALAADDLARRVRASSRSAPSRASIEGVSVTVVSARVSERTLAAGCVEVRDGLPVLGTGRGSLIVERLVPAGRSEMDGASFARGARLGPGATWGSPA